MRLYTGGIAHVSSTIEDDLRSRDTQLHKAHIAGLSDLVASALACRSANSSEWITVLPRKDCTSKSKERYISRLLSNTLISPLDVMGGYIPEIASMAGSSGQTVVLMLDQSKISLDFECLMVSLRIGERAIPVAWKVIKTKGAIGFDIQKILLDNAAQLLPEGLNIMLSGDRFYGTSALINWCKQQGWQYRIRLKGNLIFENDGGEITCSDALKIGLSSLESAKFKGTEIETSIGILYEAGYKEPWFIAMDCQPNKYKILDYGMRWGIECLFSDFKSRGFSITKTQLIHEDRIERLILVLTIALYWAVSTGMQPPTEGLNFSKKKHKDR